MFIPGIKPGESGDFMANMDSPETPMLSPSYEHRQPAGPTI